MQFHQDYPMSHIFQGALDNVEHCFFDANIAIANYRFTHTSWQCIPSVVWLRILFPPLDSRAEQKTLPLAETRSEKGVNHQVCVHFNQSKSYARSNSFFDQGKPFPFDTT